MRALWGFFYMRNPNDPITGFEDEYIGTVGHEKAVHRTHFHVPKMFWHTEDSDYEWVMYRPGRWKRVRKKNKEIVY